MRPDRRGEGLGHVLMAHLETWAAEIGIDQLWVATGGQAVLFYQQCGWERVEDLLTQHGEMATILTKQTSPPLRDTFSAASAYSGFMRWLLATSCQTSGQVGRRSLLLSRGRVAQGKAESGSVTGPREESHPRRYAPSFLVERG
ncbi:MAG: GNAT family N-acetyltransferase [Ktedonobacterales bacterium]